MLFAPSGKGRKRQKKGEKGRFRPISRKGGQTSLKLPFLYTPICSSPNEHVNGPRVLRMVEVALTMRPESITQIIRKQFFCVTDVCAIGKFIPRQLMCVIGTCTESTLSRRVYNIENGPTCYRAPKWPDPEFPRKIPKKYPPARNSGLPEFTPKIPRKYRKNTHRIPKMRIFGIFSVFFWYFLGVPEFRPEGYFFSIFRGNSGSGHLGAL